MCEKKKNVHNRKCFFSLQVGCFQENICYGLVGWARKESTALRNVVAKNVLIGITEPETEIKLREEWGDLKCYSGRVPEGQKYVLVFGKKAEKTPRK